MKYINATNTVQTFYGVEFKPGDVKDVPGYINADGFFRADTLNIPEDTKTEPKAAEQEKTEPAEDKAEKSTKGRKSKESEN